MAPEAGPPTGSEAPVRLGRLSVGGDGRQVVALLLVVKLASMILIGALLSAAGVAAGFGVSAMSEPMADADVTLSVPAKFLAKHPLWGLLAGVPAIACGVIGLVWRRTAWLCAILGTIVLVAAVVVLAFAIFGTLVDLQDQMLA